MVYLAAADLRLSWLRSQTPLLPEEGCPKGGVVGAINFIHFHTVFI